jgi:hypothetical protein
VAANSTVQDPYAAYQQPVAADPYAAYQQPLAAGPVPTPLVDMSNVAGAGPGGPPQPANYSQSPAATSVLKPSLLAPDQTPGTAAQRLFGDKPLTNSAAVVGQHLKQFVAAPYREFTAPPSTPEEFAVQGTQGQAGLAAYRMLAQPTVDNAGAAYDAFKAGDVTTGAQRAMDAIPVAGPWARKVENDAQTYGAIPALLGLGTDIAAPKAAGGLYARATNLAGKGMQAAASTPAALKVAATRALVTGTPGEMLNRSLKPPVTMPDFEQSVEASLPKIAAQNPQGVSGFAQAAQQSKNAANDWYQNLKAPYVNTPIDASPIADAQQGSIPITNQIENPNIFDATAAKGNNYRPPAPAPLRMSPFVDESGKPIASSVQPAPPQPLTLGTIDDVRRDTNAKLDGYFAKSGGDRNAALSDPETARTNATNQAARNLVYQNLEDLSGVPKADIAANQTLYGHLSDVAQVAGKRATVAGRANPLSLQESLALHGNPLTQAYNFGTARLFKALTDSDAVTNAAVDRFNNPSAIYLPPRPTPFAQALSAVGTGVGQASKLRPFLAPSIASKGYQGSLLPYTPPVTPAKKDPYGR